MAAADNIVAAATSKPSGKATDASQRARKVLRFAAAFWFSMTVLGQSLFFVFILAFYYPPTLTGAFVAWNSKPLITGYRAADTSGNLVFGAHVLLAALITACGLVQLVPIVRRRWPQVHRWNGRVYMVTALFLALLGLWLVWVRGSYLNLVGAAGVTLDGLLIVVCTTLAWHYARVRRFSLHRRWALRTFVVASAVWFLRVGYMAWGIITRDAGTSDAMNGPFDVFIAFGNSLAPLAVLELYLRVHDGQSSKGHLAMAALLFGCGLFIAVGSIAAWLEMWRPYL